MNEKDLQIMSLAAAHDAAQIVSGLGAMDPGAAFQIYTQIHDQAFAWLKEHVAGELVSAGFPGSTPVAQPFQGAPVTPGGPMPQLPAVAPGMPMQTGPTAAAGAPTMPFPQYQAAPGAPVALAPEAMVQGGGPPPATAAPAGGGPDDDWRELIQSPNNWYDNRLDKRNEKAPDFKHKTKPDPKNSQYKVSLWLRDCPEWAKPYLGVQ